MEQHPSFNPDNHFGGMPMAMALSAIAKSGGQMQVHLPIAGENSAYRGWLFENPTSTSSFGFWHAGFVLLDPNTGESWLTVSFVPNHLGGIDIVHTEIKSTKIRKLNIIHKVESSGFSFGFFSLQKLEMKHYFKDWRTKVYQSQSTRLIRLDAAGNRVEVDSRMQPELPEAEVALLSSSRQLSTSLDPIYNKVTCEDLAECHGEYYPQIVEEYDAQGELSDVALLAAPETVTRNNGESEAPGLYIKTGGQPGVPAINMAEIYLVNRDGDIQVLSRNVCTQVAYDTYRKTVTRSSSGSGPFKKSKIKTRIKALSRSLNTCGEFGFTPQPLEPKAAKLI